MKRQRGAIRAVEKSPEEIQEQAHYASLLKAIAETQDRQAFEEFFRHYAGRIKAYAMKSPGISGSVDLAEEVVQDTMLKIWRKAGLFDQSKANVDAWVFTIARNVRIDMQRKSMRGDVPLRAEDVLQDTEMPEPLVQFKQREIADNINAGLAEINAEQALVLKKMYLEGKTQSEIAAEFNLPLGTVKSRTRLALARLRLLLQEKEL